MNVNKDVSECNDEGGSSDSMIKGGAVRKWTKEEVFSIEFIYFFL